MKRPNFAARRGFLVRATAALSAPMTLAAASGAASAPSDETLATRLAALEDANAIRDLRRAYLRAVNAREWNALLPLFADPAQARRSETLGEIVAATDDEGDLEIAADRRAATARLPCTVQIEAPIDAPGCTLVEMARLQGEGTLRHRERRTLVQAFVRADDAWRIEHSVLLDTDA